jgi:UDP-3-O-[3-hydroxymyristoyl] glucosamine N-acyltransferase
MTTKTNHRVTSPVRVTDRVRVTGRAKVTGRARVIDHVMVTGRARVTGHVRVTGGGLTTRPVAPRNVIVLEREAMFSSLRTIARESSTV